MYFNQVEFGKRVMEQRKRLGLTQEELALRLNIGYSHENKMENGHKGCSIDLLLEMSELFGVPSDYLLKGAVPDRERIKEKIRALSGELEALIQSF